MATNCIGLSLRAIFHAVCFNGPLAFCVCSLFFYDIKSNRISNRHNCDVYIRSECGSCPTDVATAARPRTATHAYGRVQTASASVSGCSPPRPSLSYVTGDTICTHSLTEIHGSPFFDNTAIQPRAVWSTGLFCGRSIIVEQSTGHNKRSRHTNNINI